MPLFLLTWRGAEGQCLKPNYGAYRIECGGPGGHIQGHVQSLFSSIESPEHVCQTMSSGVSLQGRWPEIPHLCGSCILVCVSVEESPMQAAMKWIQCFSDILCQVKKEALKCRPNTSVMQPGDREMILSRVS